ncbi:MAG TPA: molybdopterin-dependent oxidoreductase [Gemmatimonadaceae bacterium]|nr:molybdopterin-dependent oxidoreductase [Gemmatimonadaceae bacterium]
MKQPSAISHQPSAEQNGVKRRDFLKVLGVSGGAAATLVGCTSERVERLIPYLVSPDETVPGVSNYYATTCRECATGCGVIAETRDGRTIKLEGNPDHPMSRGALCSRGQAALQGLYNPDRYRGPMIREGGVLKPATWDAALQLFVSKLAELRTKGNAGNAAFINAHESGSFRNFLDTWLAGYGIPAHLSYDPEADYAAISANRQSYGVAWPRYDFSAAKLVVSIGADFLDGWGASVPQQLDFADARAKVENAPRLIYVGPRRSLTGLNADQWINARPGSEAAIVALLAGTATPQAVAQQTGVDAAVLAGLQREVASAKPSLILAGGGTPDGLALCTAANALNQSLGNVGTTVKPGEAIPGFEGIDPPSMLRALAQRMQAGQVPMLMVRGANPAYTMARSSGFATAMAKVPFKVSFSSVPDETSSMADLILPDHHSLEQWGDAEAGRGIISLQQPTMDPVFDTRATSDVLLSISNPQPAGSVVEQGSAYRRALIGRIPGGAAALTAALPKGVMNGTMGTTQTTRPVPAALPAKTIDQTSGNYFLVVYPHPMLGLGGGANKPWLQEIPDPVTKICWQTVVEMHPSAATKLGVKNGDHVTVQTAAGSITAAVLTYIGIRPDTIAVAAGRGQENSGRYAKAGLNAFDLLPYVEDRSGGMSLVATKAKVSPAAGYSLIVTTEGSARQHGRGIGQAIVVADLKSGAKGEMEASGSEHAAEAAPQGSSTTKQKQRALGEEHEEGEPEFPGDASHEFGPGLRSPIADDAQGILGGTDSKYKGMYAEDHWSGMAKRRWAMTVDLARCTGCAACVTACYAENNIPTVGADWQTGSFLPDRTGFGANITRSREMAWIRLERYFEGGEDGGADFDTRFVPMMCQQCGNAPCEPVCPVYATYHAPDGLNVQVYNRCVGTRYCSNNCPYKVRYFNWFGYGEPARPQYAFPEPLNWQLNPDVTVRGKGVMEKCTFCVQRIRESENRAALEHRGVEADEFTTACAEACPSRAITFGDAADEKWSVAKMVKDRRAYHVFEELNTYTAVVYLKKVLHPAGGEA